MDVLAETSINGAYVEQVTSATLYQNTPNPFSKKTEIRFFIPDEVKNAFVFIYDMQGKQIKQIKLEQRGQGYETISGSEFTPGIYLYALIVDGFVS